MSSSGFADVGPLLARGAGQRTLITLAQNTGGRAILPRNDFGKALGEVDQISRHSYVLAFEPAAKSDRAA